MDLVIRVNDEIKQAMRSKDSMRLDAIRALRNEIIKLEKSGGDSDITDDGVIKLVKTLIKQRQDSIAMFEKAGRDELIEIEASQMAILQEFLPEQLSEDELSAIILQAIQEVDASTMRDMGKVMKTVAPLIAETGKDADNRFISTLVKSKLSEG